MEDIATLLTIRIPDFEAAIRKAADPGLAGRPVAVVTALKPMGRVLAVCPDARAAGLETEISYPMARVHCPDAIFFTPERELADRFLGKLMDEAGNYSPLVEAAGGGRVLLDTRGTERLWGPGCRVAERLRRDIGEKLRLPAVAGLAVNRPWSLLASIAAEKGGICHVAPGAEAVFLDHVPAIWIDGLTLRTKTRLLELNIRYLGQLRQFSRGEIFRQFGPGCGGTIWRALHPHPWDSLACAAGPAAAGDDAVRVEAALGEASAEEEKLLLVARSLAVQAAETLRARDLGAARLRLALLHSDGMLKTAQARLGGFIQDEAALIAGTRGLLGKVFLRRVRVSRLWLTAEKLARPERQGVLFAAATATATTAESPAETGAKRRLLSVVDGIHEKFGSTALRPGVLVSRPKAV